MESVAGRAPVPVEKSTLAANFSDHFQFLNFQFQSLTTKTETRFDCEKRMLENQKW